MANLTNKLKNRARREEQRENFSAAIELYSRALRAGERDGAVDVSLYNRIGDIYLRLDDVDSAIGYYERAIVRYAEQDLYTSAIALCNKVLRVQPSRISAYLQLGRLQLETGLMAEARVNYLRYATELLTRGQSDEAEAALEEYVVRTEDLNSALRFAGALVANDRGDEALSLLLRLKARLESLDWDVAPLERPIAAIQEFAPREAPSRPATAETTEAKQVVGSHPTSGATDLDSIGDLEAELEAAVTEEDSDADEPAAARAEAPPFGEAAPIEANEDAPLGATEEPTAVASVETPDLPAESDLAPFSTPAELEASEGVEEDERRARVPPEGVEAVEADPQAAEIRPARELEPAERGGEDPDRDSREPDREAAEAAEAVVPPADVDRPPEGPVEAPPVASSEGEEREEEWFDEDDAGAAAPSPERSERSTSGFPAGFETPGAVGETPETALPATPGPRTLGETPAPADGPEADVLVPAARMGAAPAHEEAEAPLETGASPAGDEAEPAEPLDGPESVSAAPDVDGPRPGPLPSIDQLEPASGRSESQPTRTVSRDPELERSEEIPGGPAVPAGTTAEWTVEADPAEAPEMTPLAEASPAEIEDARRSLEAGRASMERGELERAIEELERAARSSMCFLEARALLEECRERQWEDGAEAEAEPDPVLEAEPDPVLEVEPDPVLEAEPDPVLEAEPDPVLEAEPEPVGADDVDSEPLPEVAVGSAEPSRSSWLLSTAQATARAGEERLGSGEAEEEMPVGGRPPDEPFRLWLAAASYDVLKRALEELERREELQRALCVVERMLELKPDEPSLHRIRIAHAAELGRDDLLPEAYMGLAGLLEASGDLLGAYGAYERVRELDPERPELEQELREAERRIAEAGLQIAAPTESEVDEDEEAFDEPGVPTPYRPSRDRDGEPSKEAEDRDARGAGVQVYRGVVQDLPSGHPAEPDPAADPLDTGMEASVDFDVILAELKDQLAERMVDEPDSRSRTEVGERLMEMGLLDDAIRELQSAVRAPDAPPRAYELLGRAFIEKGQPRVATRLLEESLDKLSDHVPEERLLGVLYQLGVACQDSEESERALECYERIFSVDIDYRDVRDRMEACAA